MSCIEIKNITKQFGSTIALKDVSLKFEGNKIYGLLGRNGAGKSTLLNLITNRLFPTSGEIYVDGENIRENGEAISKIYNMSEKNLYPETMKIKEAFRWSKVFYPNMDMEYALKLADKFALSLKKKVKELSTGYASVFKIIIALSSNAPILLLDEPVLGLDANFRDLFYKELISCYSKTPKTIVISTHLIEEAEGVLEDVAIIKNGQVILKDTTQNILSKGYTVTGPECFVNSFVQGKNVLGFDMLGGIKSAYLLESLNKNAVPGNLEVSAMKLQDLFIHLTNA
ncbi:MAG: ABC transporter ATP-binding protein [Christensenellales bacterium]|jgi:ABC-2 type transport system ATP-binding protein